MKVPPTDRSAPSGVACGRETLYKTTQIHSLPSMQRRLGLGDLDLTCCKSSRGPGAPPEANGQRTFSAAILAPYCLEPSRSKATAARSASSACSNFSMPTAKVPSPSRGTVPRRRASRSRSAAAGPVTMHLRSEITRSIRWSRTTSSDEASICSTWGLIDVQDAAGRIDQTRGAESREP